MEGRIYRDWAICWAREVQVVVVVVGRAKARGKERVARRDEGYTHEASHFSAGVTRGRSF